MSGNDIVTAERLLELSAAAITLQGLVGELAAAANDEVTLVERVRSHMKLRRPRDRILPGGLFAEPSWDILLDLYVAHQADKPLSVSAVCTIPGVPPTTALRHVKHLVDRGYVVRQPSPNDGRRVYLHLASDMMRQIAAVFDRG